MIDLEGRLNLYTNPLQGLVYYGVVTDIPGANAFSCRALAGLGAGKFTDSTYPWYAFVLRDAGGAGAAPQGQIRPITVYATATGSFTTTAFTAAVAVGDEMLIMHESQVGARVLCCKDQWCATPIASLAISNAAADLTFSDVVFPANFLPTGAVIDSVYLMFHWRKQIDTSLAINAISAANKTIRVKKAAGAWGTDDVVGITFANGQLSTAAAATETGGIIIGSADIDSEVDDTNGVTYNVRSDQTNRADALVVTAASLTLYDIYTGLRVYYRLV